MTSLLGKEATGSFILFDAPEHYPLFALRFQLRKQGIKELSTNALSDVALVYKRHSMQVE